MSFQDVFFKLYMQLHPSPFVIFVSLILNTFLIIWSPIIGFEVLLYDEILKED